MKVMDCRYRPTTAAWMDTFVKSPVYADYVKVTGFDRKPVKSLDECAAQLRELGVEKAVITGRDIESTFATPSSNPLVDASVEAFPSLFIGVYGFDPHKGMQGYRAMKAALREKRSAGASIEPGMARCPVDNALYYPLYALCCDLGVPVMVTAGLSPYMPGVLLDSTAPARLDKVASDFPELRMLISHGGYPWVNETIAVCMRHRNLFIDFSSTAGKPMSEQYALAASGSLSDRFVFSSANPFADVDKALAGVMNMDLTEETRRNVLYNNARKLFSHLW